MISGSGFVIFCSHQRLSNLQPLSFPPPNGQDHLKNIRASIEGPGGEDLTTNKNPGPWRNQVPTIHQKLMSDYLPSQNITGKRVVFRVKTGYTHENLMCQFWSIEMIGSGDFGQKAVQGRCPRQRPHWITGICTFFWETPFARRFP